MSLIHGEFGVAYNKIRCGDRDAWNWMHTRALENSDPLAEATLAIGYFRGFIDHDAEKGIELGSKCISWLRSQSDKNSIFCLGEFYARGIVVSVDLEEAARYWRLAAEAESELAQTSLGYYVEHVLHDLVGAAKCYRMGAEKGVCIAQHNLALCYKRGTGVDVDYVEAAYWFHLAAVQGDPDAQASLGVCYELGRGVPKNLVEMIRWYGLAVDQNNAIGQFNLALCYEVGRGVTKDINEAIRLYTLSSNQGDVDAAYRLSKLLDVVEKDG